MYSGSVEWTGSAKRGETAMERTVARIVAVLRERARCESSAMYVAAICEALQNSPTKGPLAKHLQEMTDDPQYAVHAVQKATSGVNGKANRFAWHYYIDLGDGQ